MADVGPRQINLKPRSQASDDTDKSRPIEIVAKGRVVLERARTKMANLRRQVEKKEIKGSQQIQDHSTKDVYYTDIYGGTEPSVNDELKQRLSPAVSHSQATKTDVPKVTVMQEPSSQHFSCFSSARMNDKNVQVTYDDFPPGCCAVLYPAFPPGVQVRSPMSVNISEAIQKQNSALHSSEDQISQSYVVSEKSGNAFDVCDKSFNVPDLEESMPKLLVELTSAKDLNQELAEKLSDAENEIESMKLMQELAEVSIAAHISSRGAKIVDEIYVAQKARDEAIMGRLRLANDERDEAIARTRNAETDGSDSGTDVNSNDEDFFPGNDSVSHLLGRLKHAKSSNDIEKYGSSIVNKISNTNDCKKHITAEEMKAIIYERDVAVAKCKRLERDFSENYRCSEFTPSRNKDLQELQIQLQSTRQERDIVLAKARKLEDELQTLRIYYSLHKSLSQEANLRDQFNNTLGNIEEQVKARDEVLIKAHKDKNHLATQLKIAIDERTKVTTQLHHSSMSQRELQEKCDKLERLVVVLRKKLVEGNVKTIN